MARQVMVEILGNAKQYIAATEEANLASTRLGGGLGKASGAAKTLEKDLTGMGKSAAGGIPLIGNFGNSLGGLPIPALAAAAAIGTLVIAGKSIIDISDKWEAAQRGLKQATDAAGVSNDKARQFVDKFIGSNKKYVTSQAEVVDSYASLIRSGLSAKEVQRDLNIALDLSALKHISLSEATGLVNKAEHGRMRGLVDLGIVSKDLIDAQGNLIAGTKGVAAAMDAAEKRTRGGRDATSDLEQASNRLGNVWQSFAKTTGPFFNKMLAAAVGEFTDLLSGILNVIEAIGNLVGAISKIDVTKIPVLGGIVGAVAASGGPVRHGGPHGRAAGGDVLPNSVYTVGERGPETLVMGSQGGTVIPHGGGGMNVSLVVNGFVGDNQQLFKVFRDGIRRLDRAQA